MKKRFITGFLCGAVLFGTIGVFAGQYTATENVYPIKLNGSNVALEGYQINDYTYFKLRDIGEKVGFDVDFQNDTILINTKEGGLTSNTAQETETKKSSLIYETINGVEYISAKNAHQYFDEQGWSARTWSLATQAYKPNPTTWCYLCRLGGGYFGNETTEEYEIETVIINNVQYISREVFERDVLARVNADKNK